MKNVVIKGVLIILIILFISLGYYSILLAGGSYFGGVTRGVNSWIPIIISFLMAGIFILILVAIRRD